MSSVERRRLREEVRGMFYHGYDAYMRRAFPADELHALTCSPASTWGDYALTLVDSLDTLAVMGNVTEFSRAVAWVGNNVHFDRDRTVSVFETNIRVMGSLLSAHLLASRDDGAFWDEASGGGAYQGVLLHMAEDLGRRLLPAFDTSSGIPYGVVNFRYGVPRGETTVTSTAGGGTFALEFGVLSRLTGDPVFERAALRALRSIFGRRSKLGLVGNHIDIESLVWTSADSDVGASIDSFLEYLLKAHVLLGDREYLTMFEVLYAAVDKHVRHGVWYPAVHMDLGSITWPTFNALEAFWPGLQVMYGHLARAAATHEAMAGVWRRLGVTPEGFNLVSRTPQDGQLGYPLRPELAESTYLLYRATRDGDLLDHGRDMIVSLQYLTRTACGFSAVRDVTSHALEDHMDSYFLAETVKYLFLLFDEAGDDAAGSDDGEAAWVHSGAYVFNTEAHLLPIDAVRDRGHPDRFPADPPAFDETDADPAKFRPTRAPGCRLPRFHDRLSGEGVAWPPPRAYNASQAGDGGLGADGDDSSDDDEDAFWDDDEDVDGAARGATEGRILPPKWVD